MEKKLKNGKMEKIGKKEKEMKKMYKNDYRFCSFSGE